MMAVEVAVDSVSSPDRLEDHASDMTIVADRSAVSVDVLNNSAETFKLGFTLDDLYKVSLDFYKKEKEELTLGYSDKVQLVALWKQITAGRYSQSKMPEVGYFDVIGNDRRKAWEALADMSKDTAKEKFCETLEERCPSYVDFITAKRAEIDAEIERKRLEEEERLRLEAEERERLRLEEEERLRLAEEERLRKEEEERLRIEEEERLAREEEEKRKKLAEEEEEARLLADTDEDDEAEVEGQAKPEEEPVAATTAMESTETPSTDGDQTSATALPEETPKLVGASVSSVTGKPIAPASLWARPKLAEFISHVKRDASSVLIVGRGETVTVSVPTHALGSCLFWEFATETYDVGFGVYFEWADADGLSQETRQIVINENEDNQVEVVNKPNVDEVLPTVRRNSHEQVVVGSHLYPGTGTYLLKFDNSYSLLRSKTLYYRVYYTK